MYVSQDDALDIYLHLIRAQNKITASWMDSYERDREFDLFNGEFACIVAFYQACHKVIDITKKLKHGTR